MRRDEILSAFANLEKLFAKLKWEEVTEQLRGMAPDAKLDTSSTLTKYSTYMEYYNNASETERYIISAYGLDALAEPQFWAGLISREDPKRSSFFEINYSINTLKRSIKNLTKILERSSDGFSETLEGLTPAGNIETIKVDKIRILLRENDNPDIKVSTLVSILNDIQSIYDVIVEIYDLPHTELIVGSIDSGSDKSIDIIGIAEAVNKLSGLILEGWDRIRFNKEQKMEKSFKSVSEGIDILDKMKKSQEKQSISAEEAEKLKRTVIRGMENLIGNGVYTPETEKRSPTRPSEISFERKLSITYQDKDGNDSNKNNVDTKTEKIVPKANIRVRTQKKPVSK